MSENSLNQLKSLAEIPSEAINPYKGEIIYYNKGSVRLGMFIEEVSRNDSLVALGSQVLVVENQYITFADLTPASPQKKFV